MEMPNLIPSKAGRISYFFLPLQLLFCADNWRCLDAFILSITTWQSAGLSAMKKIVLGRRQEELCAAAASLTCLSLHAGSMFS
jgi:hypothetical protein